MSEVAALEGFTGKWRASWPEWAVAEAFVPTEQREVAHAWFSLRDELSEAAWGGADPRPGDAKLAWWVEELDGWSRGARRHPLGLVLQAKPVSWRNLAACLPALRASRERPKDLETALFSLEPYAEALAGVAQGLFAAQTPAPSRSVVISLLAERLLRHPDQSTPLGDLDACGWATTLLQQWPPPGQGSCPGRIHAALVRGRLQRFAEGKPPMLPPLSVLADAWRAARA
ncbi:MAG: phytoene/squalene synthase family protein [Pseudomonadota bacterium]|nr:phytoene/squalene synthase family protein [Pseudomonadota bacterium]MDQ3160702.1 phytoene/squalene synthase family protein [Pseudomonadota bacterium]